MKFIFPILGLLCCLPVYFTTRNHWMREWMFLCICIDFIVILVLLQ